ncbi:MAG: hypothetical protein C0501_12405 [Isosphaera sp.]|nr:hypothetical protein [Isosphaera sp.]
MRTTRAVAPALALLLAATPSRAAETPVTGKIVAADLFKNGLAVIRCEVTLGKPGEYVLDHVPTPVHGTFWVESAAPVEAAVRTGDVNVPVAEAAPGNLQDDFAGKAVTVHFKGGKRDPVSGTVLKMKRAKADEPGAGRYLVLRDGASLKYLDPSEVAAVESREPVDTVVRRKPRLVLTLGATDKAETKVALRYLTTGLAWAPSYRVDISDPKTLTVEQRAVVKNELADLDGAELRLISGYPSVQYAHVRSPLAPGSSLATFFSELAGRFQYEIDALSNSVVTQQAIGNRRGSAVGTSLGATPTGEGVDLHYQPIGKRTLADGDSLSVVVAGGKAEYERVVEWLVPDTRDEDGRPERRGRGSDRDADGEPWDALRFKNPLPFPMTTAPATVTANGAFNGQRTSYWVNSGEEMVLRVEKALSVRTRATETEAGTAKNGDRDFVWVGGRQYRRVTVEGELAVSNHRKEAVQVVARRRFSGDLARADGAPKSALLEEGVYSVNKRNELVWTLPLKAGEEKTVKYTYTVLVAH